MRQPRRTSIVATVGPRLGDAARIFDVIAAGADGFRMPLARQSDRAVELAEMIRDQSVRAGRAVRIFLDIPGPRRFLHVQRSLGPRDEFTATVTEHGKEPEDGVPLFFGTDIDAYLAGTAELYTGDGEARLTLLDIAGGRVRCRVDAGDLAAGVHGITVPGRAAPLTRISDVHRRVATEVPWADVLLSFVESAAQVDQLASVVRRDPGQLWAKIETDRGVRNAVEIANRTGGVLIGRGDLLLETGMAAFPGLEADAIQAVRSTGRPLMVGTQLWTASTRLALPHRSELSWIWHLMTSGVDYVLLSDETTVGPDPAGTVRQLVDLAQVAGTGHAFSSKGA